MLKVKKDITLTGTSEIEGQQVAYMSATIGKDGNKNASVSRTITNQELYNSNKTAVRKDMNDFELEVYKVEDELNQVEV